MANLARLPHMDAVNCSLRSQQAFDLLSKIFSQAEMEVLNDALHLYASTPDWWGCDEERDIACIMADALDAEGFNTVLPEHNVLLTWDFPEDG